MALTRRSLGSFKSSTSYGTGSYTPAAFTPSDNSLLIVVVFVSINSGVTNPDTTITCAGGGLTWTRRANIGSDSSWACGMAVFTAPVVTGASMQITLDCGSMNVYVYAAQVFEETGYDTSTPTGATATDAAFGPDGADSLTLSGAPASGSEVFGFLSNDPSDVGTIATTEGTGWTELYDNYTSGAFGLESQVRGGSTSTSVPWQDVRAGTAPVGKMFACALEIKAAAGGGGPPPGSSTSMIALSG